MRERRRRRKRGRRGGGEEEQEEDEEEDQGQEEEEEEEEKEEVKQRRWRACYHVTPCLEVNHAAVALSDLVERGVGQVQVRAVAAAPPLVAGQGQGRTPRSF